MACRSYLLLISRYLDGTLNEQERSVLQEHLGRCASCRLALYRYQRMDDHLRCLPTRHAPDSCRREVFRRADALDRGWVVSIRQWPARWAALTVILAAVVLAPLLFWPMIQPSGLAQQLASLGRVSGTLTATQPSSVEATEPTPHPVGSADVALAGYIPPASSIEQAALLWDETAKQPVYVQIVFVAPKGTKVRFERNLRGAATDTVSDMSLTKAIIVHGQVWRYAGRVNADGVQTFRLVHSSDSGDLTVLEGSASLDELVRLLQWLQ